MKTILRIDRKVDWLPPGAELRITGSDTPAPLELTTSVHALCFSDDRILMVSDRDDRGWNVPGGHIEEGEDQEEALERELEEEAAAAIEIIKPIGYYHIHIEGREPPNLRGPYPDGYLQLYFCILLSLAPFTSDFETTARRLLPPDEARELDWVKSNTETYDLGLGEARRYRARRSSDP